MTIRTEDQVRDYAKVVLGFDEAEENIVQGTGQIKSFKTDDKTKSTKKDHSKDAER